jgi:prepilin-type N-terminal cleavage/methylation domain-containing protein
MSCEMSWRPSARRAGGRPGPRSGGQAGFTLLEVLVALAILGLAVVASIQGFAQGLRLLKLSGDNQRAMLLADQKTREVVKFEEGMEEGVEGDFRWSRTTTLIPAPELTPLTGEPLWNVWQVLVRVQWDERRFLDLSTMRTLPRHADALVVATPPGTPGPGQPGAGQPGRPQTGQPPGRQPPPGQRPGSPRPGTPRSTSTPRGSE